jgi:2'-5' RNA ligase
MTARRLFIALPLPPAAAAEVAALQSRLKKAQPDPRWTRPEGLHITLHFLGMLPNNTEAHLTQAMDQILGNHGRLDLELGPLGVFGRKKERPQVLHLEVDGPGIDALGRMHRQLAGTLVDLELQPETRPYHPHLTLARARDRGGDHALAMLRDSREANVRVPFVADRVVLYESETHADGATYTPRHTVVMPQPRRKKMP